MKAIGFLKVDTDKVIKHLSYCIENKKPPDNLVYKVLSDLEVSSSNMPSDGYWIYHPNEKKYIRPNQTFFKKAPINKYTYLLPDEYDDIYKASSLFEDIGVKEEPNIEDYINIILQDLVQGNNYSSTQENMSPKAVVSKKDIKIYTSCVNYIAENFDISEISENLIQNLLDEPSILTHHGKFKHFDDILIDDSKWYRGFFEAENNNLEWLTELYDIDWSAFETLGLKKLSKCVELELVDASGKLVIESDLIKIFQDRKTLFLRVIQSQPLEIRTKLSTIIEKIDINSFNELIIKAHVDNNANIQYSSEPKSEIAFFKEKENQLLLSRPIKKNNYVSFFKPILNSLLIDSDVKPTLALFDAICSKSLEDGSAYLDDLDYKDFQEIETTEELIDEELVQDEKVVELEKGKYDENGKWIGSWETNQDEKITKLEEDSQTDEGLKPNNEEKQRQEEPPSFNEYDGAEDNPESTFSENLSQGQLTEQYKEEEEEDHPQHKPEYNTDSNALNKNQNITKTNETRSSSSTSSYKSKSGDSEKINTRKSERLVTYAGRGPKDSFSEKSNKLNMEIEKKSREIVLLEEKDNGRKPKAKSQTNPGYDIYSYDEKSGEERFIEVKGTANEWDKRGVSISAKQFVFSYQQGEKSWLYVVDKVFGPSPQTYKIQNFARQVNSFMFDSGWAEKMEIHNKQSKYVVGKTIIDKDVGKGVIEDVEKKGEMRILKIKFENSGTKRKPLNIERMTIEEEK